MPIPVSFTATMRYIVDPVPHSDVMVESILNESCVPPKKTTFGGYDVGRSTVAPKETV
jgi:hypothetical protein